MERKFINFDLAVKAVDGDAAGNQIEGYGSVFGNVDRVGDVAIPGAFAKSLALKTPKMLFQHNPNEIIGRWTGIEEDEKGLKVTGEFANTPRGNEVKELVRIGAIDGLSIGYKTIDAEYNTQGHYLLKEIDLWEISVVTFPCNEEAVIDAIKAAEMTKREVEAKLRDAGFSKTVAQALLTGGYDAIQTKRDSKSDEGRQEVLAALKSVFSNSTK